MITPIPVGCDGAQISVKSHSNEYRIMMFVGNIMCVEKVPATHYVCITYVANDGRVKCVETRGSVDKFMNLLRGQFVKVNAYTIINLRFLVAYSSSNCILLYGEYEKEVTKCIDFGDVVREIDFR